MRKWLIVTAILVLFVSNAWSTETRTLTMGDNNVVLLDDDNVFIFPSRINEYPNLAVGEFGDSSFQRLGMHWQFDKDNPFVIATYFENRETPFMPSDLFGAQLVPFDDPLLDNRRINLLYGRMLGDWKFGFGFDMKHSSRTTDQTNDESKESFSFYDFTVGLTPEEGEFDVALGLGLGTFTDQDENGLDESKPDGYTEFSLLGRYFLKQSPTNVWIPHAGLFLTKHGVELYNLDGDVDDLDLSQTNTMTTLEAGIGLNYEPMSSVLAVADFGVRYHKLKQENDTSNGYTTVIEPEQTVTTTTFPYFKIGLDASVFRWLDVRLGATSSWDNESTEVTLGQGQTQEKLRFADNETYLGFGFHWGNLHVDTYTDPDLFLDGFNFISGGTNDMNFRISVLYEMK